ncbi:MAG TPA: Spy/CpxP family protein refolding chaperone [Xanthobacteraceae bacterium]|nr:Spy/CpxP family protein refolding chaperone [Xanthobacteraceae bacterium]
MRAHRLLLTSALAFAVAVPGTAEARRLPALLGAVFGTVGGLVGLHHARHRHVAHAAPHHARRVATHTPERAPRAERATSEGSAPSAQTVSASPPVWPQLPADLADYVFWPSGGDDRFWSYGYAEVLDGALRPASRRPERGAARRSQASTTVLASAAGGAPGACLGQQGSEIGNSLIERITQTVSPDAAQQNALADLRDAVRHGFDYFDAACPTDRPQSPTARLDAMEDRLWAARQALLVVRGPLAKFYDSLRDEQKARLNRPQSAEREATCAQGNPELPISAPGAKPDPDQRAGLEALKSTSAMLAKLVASSCPSAMPATPVGRLDAADKRLNELLYAVVTLRAPLDGYYAALTRSQTSGAKASR